MAVTFEPLTGQLINIPGSGGGAGAISYVFPFLIADWSAPVGNLRSLSIPATTHSKGLNPIIEVFEHINNVYTEVYISTEVDSATGDITLYIPNTTDLRFDGKALIR